jgi:hypothetical protein
MEKKEPTGDGEGGGRPHAHGEGRDGGVGPCVKKSGGGWGRERRWSCSGPGKEICRGQRSADQQGGGGGGWIGGGIGLGHGRGRRRGHESPISLSIQRGEALYWESPLVVIVQYLALEL